MKLTNSAGLALNLLLAAPATALASELGPRLSLFLGIPFAGMLLSIALFPLFAPKFWSEKYQRVALFWALILAVPFTALYRGDAIAEFLRIFVADYVPFLILLGSLFTVTGGIHVKGTPSGNPEVNTFILFLGTVLASLIGTTGAAMLLVRPLLRANARRKRRAHQMIFFIFLVCNVGGSLTPLGDPPLFLGFLHGVPFSFTLRLMPETGLVAAILLSIFYVLDRWYYHGDKHGLPHGEELKLGLEGGMNLLYLAGIILAVLLSGIVEMGEVNFLGVETRVVDLARDGALIFLSWRSYRTTHEGVRKRNHFHWHPMKEVAILFAAIFTTMAPVLLILQAGSEGSLAFVTDSVKTPANYFWATGILSGFLDNAPTYLVFLSTALGKLHKGLPEQQAIRALLSQNADYLKAISCGAVFMGALSYIGNAPNFMVLAISEEEGVEMPSFFGYMFKYSLIFLVPAFIIVTWLFF